MGMTEKKNENLTASTLPNFGIIFFEYLIITYNVLSSYIKLYKLRTFYLVIKYIS